ncbi:MAG TPA: MlaD family protein [Solirubrobacteraceae bacterium]|nr:MlaD family protein [Solirubrobacteraceae bacterium]
MKRRRHTSRESRRRTLVAAAVGVLILGALSYAALTAGNGLPLKTYYYLDARFADGAEIDPYSDVRIGGVLVGQVLSSGYSDGAAVVKLQLQPSIEPLRTGTTARIRLRGLIGAKYVELTRGRGRALPSGATLPLAHTSTAVGVFDVLSLVDAKHRAELRSTLSGLGEGFLGRGAELNQSLTDAPSVLSGIAATAEAVNVHPGAAARFFPSAQSFSAALYPVRQVIAEGWAPQAAAIAPFTQERSSVQSLLREAPPAEIGIRQGLNAADPLLVQTAGWARATVRLTGPAPAALNRAATLLADARPPLRQARTLLTTLAGATPPTLALLGALAPLGTPAARTLANQIPILSSVTAHGCDVGRWTTAWGSLFGEGTAPNSVLGPVGLARSALAVNNRATAQNAPGGIANSFYPKPCAPLPVLK